MVANAVNTNRMKMNMRTSRESVGVEGEITFECYVSLLNAAREREGGRRGEKPMILYLYAMKSNLNSIVYGANPLTFFQ